MNLTQRRELFVELFQAAGNERKKLYKAWVGEHMIPAYEWPVQKMMLFFSKHLVRDDRFALVTFLLGNGWAPVRIVEWLKAEPGCLANDNAALDVKGIIERYIKGEFADKTIWNVDAKATVDLAPPGFATDFGKRILRDEDGKPFTMPAGRDFFTDAITDLVILSRMLPKEKYQKAFSS